MNNETQAKPARKRHTALSALLVTLVLLIGLSLLLYPTVADYLNSLNYRRDIEDFRQNLQQLDDSERQALLDAAREWNDELLDAGSRIGELNAERRQRYSALLDPFGSGMMGYIEIEKAGIYLPIYHGTEESVLQAGVGHIEGSSLPVGGTGTHTILSGHTGLPSSKLFSNIDQLEVGDTFLLHILGEVLTYRVESTVVVLPEEAEKQEFDPQRDLCTLMTCTPYGINSHRLLVRGVRIETPVAEQPDPEKPVEPIPAPVPPVLWAAAIGLPSLLVVIVLVLVVRKRRRKRKCDETGR